MVIRVVFSRELTHGYSWAISVFFLYSQLKNLEVSDFIRIFAAEWGEIRFGRREAPRDYRVSRGGHQRYTPKRSPAFLLCLAVKREREQE